MAAESWYRVVLPYAVAGVKVVDGRIAEAAPVFRWAEGKPLEAFVRWVASKGGTLQVSP